TGKASRQPSGHTNMIRMHVSHQHPLDGFALKPAGEQAGPDIDCLRVPHAGVDNGPAVSVLERPNIDVIEPHRQWHANPYDAGRYLQRLTGHRRSREWILENWFID